MDKYYIVDGLMKNLDEVIDIVRFISDSQIKRLVTMVEDCPGCKSDLMQFSSRLRNIFDELWTIREEFGEWVEVNLEEENYEDT